jgi:hypothetical protein
MTDTPDYAQMSGGDFKHAVGDDPAKWAEAFVQRAPLATAGQRDEQVRIMRDWFTDAMEAARVAERRYRIEGDRNG